jgi:hypothetical protein
MFSFLSPAYSMDVVVAHKGNRKRTPKGDTDEKTVDQSRSARGVWNDQSSRRPAQHFFTNLALGAAYTPLSVDAQGRIFTQNDGHLFVVGSVSDLYFTLDAKVGSGTALAALGPRD